MRFFLFALSVLLISSCAVYTLTLPSGDVSILSPRDGAYVPDTFTLTFRAFGSGFGWESEITHGFPDGPVSRSRHPSCHRVEAKVLLNGRELFKTSGCDTILGKVKVGHSGASELVVNVVVGRRKATARYHVKPSYFYTLRFVERESPSPLPPPDGLRPLRRFSFGSYDVLWVWEGEGAAYLWDGKRLLKIASGYDIRALEVGDSALVVVVGNGVEYISVSERGVVGRGRLSGSPDLAGTEMVGCRDGGGFLLGGIWVEVEADGRAHFYDLPDRMAVLGSGCVDGDPHLAVLADGEVLIVGRAGFRFPPFEGHPLPRLDFYGYGGDILFLLRDGGLEPWLLHNGRWIPTYFPWEPVQTECRSAGLGCALACPLPLGFPFFVGSSCVSYPPDIEAVKDGFVVGRNLVEVEFHRW
ncbi:MAG: hypothetical protein GXO29_07125 [Thermotogae bacterium]|nr:hypothetical protein [Thermotogota bacterium]